jgi:hypothetical protein
MALAVVLVAACDRQATFYLEVTTSPGSDLLERIDRVELRLETEPPVVHRAQRDSMGSIELSLDIDATDAFANVVVLGFDGSDALIGRGETGKLPLSGANGTIAVFVAPPWSASEAPASLPEGLTDFAVASSGTTAYFFGGSTDSIVAADVTLAYSSGTHELVAVAQMPGPRRNAIAVADGTGVIVFGGIDDENEERGQLWRFSPGSSAFSTGSSTSTLARSGGTGARAGTTAVLIPGTPAVLIDVESLTASAADDADGLAASLDSGAGHSGLVAGFAGAWSFDADGLEAIAAPPTSSLRQGHAVIAVEDGIAIVGGSDAGGLQSDAGVFKPADRSFETFSGVLSVPRMNAAVASTPRFVAVAGGIDDAGTTVAEVSFLSPADLSPIATSTLMVPRSAATAVPLANGQILIAGGFNSAGAPVTTLELLSPGE